VLCADLQTSVVSTWPQYCRFLRFALSGLIGGHHSQKKQVSFGHASKAAASKGSAVKRAAPTGKSRPTGPHGRSSAQLPRVAGPSNGKATKKMRLNLRDIEVDISNEQDAKVALRLAQNLTRKANAVLQQGGPL
jgi:hypothetical protein